MRLRNQLAAWLGHPRSLTKAKYLQFNSYFSVVDWLICPLI